MSGVAKLRSEYNNSLHFLQHPLKVQKKIIKISLDDIYNRQNN